MGPKEIFGIVCAIVCAGFLLVLFRQRNRPECSGNQLATLLILVAVLGFVLASPAYSAGVIDRAYEPSSLYRGGYDDRRFCTTDLPTPEFALVTGYSFPREFSRKQSTFWSAEAARAAADHFVAVIEEQGYSAQSFVETVKLPFGLEWLEFNHLNAYTGCVSWSPTKLPPIGSEMPFTWTWAKEHPVSALFLGGTMFFLFAFSGLVVLSGLCNATVYLWHRSKVYALGFVFWVVGTIASFIMTL